MKQGMSKDDAFTRLKDSLEPTHSGPANAGALAIIDTKKFSNNVAMPRLHVSQLRHSPRGQMIALFFLCSLAGRGGHTKRPMLFK